MTQPVYEKMSKSRGNVVLPEEVVYGVADLKPECEFRFISGGIISDYRECGIWQNCLHDKFFYTATRFGRLPVFLHYKDNPCPALLTINGKETLQHPDLKEFWDWWLNVMEQHGWDADEPVYKCLKERPLSSVG